MTAPAIAPAMTPGATTLTRPPRPRPQYGSLSQFGPGNNLIGTQFNPAADPRLQATQGQVAGLQGQVAAGQGQIPGVGQAQSYLNQAAGYTTGQRLQPTSGLLNQAQEQVGQAQLGPLQGLGGDVGQARTAALQGLQALGSAPSRSQTAQNLYEALAQQETAKSGQQIRELGQRAAALGRLGDQSLITPAAGDIFGQREANLAAIRAGLSAQTAGQEQQDILNRVSAAQGLAQGLGGLDLSQAGLGLQAGTTAANLALQRAQGLSGIAGQQFGQQQGVANLGLAQGGQLGSLAGQQLGLGQARLGAQQGVLGQLAGLESQQHGQNLGNLNFLQGERGYQQGLESQATDRAVQQRLLEDQLLNSQFGRDQSTNQLLAQYGFSDVNPLQTYIAQNYQQQGQQGQDALSTLLGSYGASRGGAGQTADQMLAEYLRRNQTPVPGRPNVPGQ